MRDARARLEKLLTDAEECDLIGKLTTNDPKRATFAKLAAEYREDGAGVGDTDRQ